MSPFGGVGGGTNPAGEEELDDVIDNLRKITRLQEPGYGLLAGEIAAAAIAADILRDLRAVVEGLRTQLAERVRDVEDLTADRDSWSDQASRVLADWDSMRRSRDALQVRVDAVKALAERWAALAPEDDWGETPGDTQQADLGRYLLRVLAGSVGVSDD